MAAACRRLLSPLQKQKPRRRCWYQEFFHAASTTSLHFYHLLVSKACRPRRFSYLASGFRNEGIQRGICGFTKDRDLGRAYRNITSPDIWQVRMAIDGGKDKGRRRELRLKTYIVRASCTPPVRRGNKNQVRFLYLWLFWPYAHDLHGDALPSIHFTHCLP